MLELMFLFVKVVQLGSMSAAGKESQLSPASVSRSIAALEQQLGVQLFNRNGRKILLTDAGSAFYQRIKPLLDEIKDVQRAARETHDSARGLLRVHAHTSVGIQFVASGVKEFCDLYPEITLDLQLSESAVNLLEQDYDVDIRLGALQDSSMLARKLAPSNRILVASPSYLDSHPPVLNPTDLLFHNCLTYRPNSEVTTWRFATLEGDIELKVTGTFHSNNAEVLRRATLSGLGIALLTNWGTYSDRQKGLLRPVLPQFPVTINSFNNGIYAVFRQARFIPKKVRVFIDFMVARSKAQSLIESDE